MAQEPSLVWGVNASSVMDFQDPVPDTVAAIVRGMLKSYDDLHVDNSRPSALMEGRTTSVFRPLAGLKTHPINTIPYYESVPA